MARIHAIVFAGMEYLMSAMNQPLQKHEVFLYHIYGYLCSISDIAWVYKNIRYIA